MTAPRGRSADRPITLVLDASAVAAFTRASIHVGEVLAQVLDGDTLAAIPVPCLVEAAHTIVDPDRLSVLVTHAAVMVVGEDPGEWQALTAAYHLVGQYEAASAGLVAVDHGAAVLTRYPGLYAGLNEGGLVIPIVD